MRLSRPVGLNELRLIFETEMIAFPPRLPEQPIFYPVLNAPYAIKIARDWNTKSEMRVMWPSLKLKTPTARASSRT